MIKRGLIACILLLCTIEICHSQPALAGRNLVRLDGSSAQVVIDCGGGSIVNFSFAGSDINPLSWNYPENGDTNPRPMGHFICFDRLGNPSPKEKLNGMPFHGEAAHVDWKVLSEPVKKNGIIRAEMFCEVPLGGMTLKRTLSLHDDSPVFHVSEEITNANKLGRVYNIVQHPSIAPPFLDETVLVDSNGTKGFRVGNPMPALEEPVVWWPKVMYRGEFADLRRLKGNHDPAVVNFIIAPGEKHGWVTACNPGQELLIGYIWEVSDYPWLRIWRHAGDGEPLARGIEFGTTPLPYPFSDILAKGSIFDRPIFEYLDAGQTVKKSYTAFLARIPADYKGVDRVLLQKDRIILREHDSGRSRDIVVKID